MNIQIEEILNINKEKNLNLEIENNEILSNNKIIIDNISETNKVIYVYNTFSHKNNENLPNIYDLMTATLTYKIDKKIPENLNNLDNNNKLKNQINFIEKNNKTKYKKKGRKKSKKEEYKIYNIHSRENDDNIRRKIKCHFHNFIINYFNNLIKIKKKGNLKFKKIKYSYALNDTMKFNKILLLNKISDFFKLDISNKYKNYQKNENELVYEKLIKRFDNEVRQLFDLTYMEFYEKYYLNEAFNNNSNFNNFYSLYEKERKKESDENKIKYLNLLKLIAEQRFINYYLPNRLFMTKRLFSN